jgi:hypothetical protein
VNPQVRAPIDSTFVADVMSDLQDLKKLLHIFVQSLHNRVSTYHYKLSGDTPECLSRLLDLDEPAMHHLLHKCELFDEKTKKYQLHGVVDQHDMFAPCTILNFVRVTYSLEKESNVNNKDFYLTIGMEDKNNLRLPRNQYGTTPSPGGIKKKKIHQLEIMPPTIRLNKYEKEVLEKLKDLLHQSIPRTARRKQQNQSCKKDSAGASQPSSSTAPQPSSSLTKKTTLSTDSPPTTRNSKAGILALILKSLTRFVTDEGGSVCVQRLGYTAKIVELSIERYRETPEEKIAPATPDRVSSVRPHQQPTEVQTEVTKTLAEMVSMLANYKTRSIEVVRGHNEEAQTVVFPPRTRNEDSFIDQARRSGWIDDVTPEPHHRRGMLMYFARYWRDDFDNVAREERKLKRTHTMETYTTESMIRNCNLTGKQFKEIKGTLLARSNLLLELHPEKLKDLEKGPEPVFEVYKYCQQGKDPEKVKLWTTDVCEEVEYAIDQRYGEMIEESKNTRRKKLAKHLPSLDYDLPPEFKGGGSSSRYNCTPGGRSWRRRLPNTLPIPSVFSTREKGKRIRLICLSTGPGGIRRM